ncbi:hydantoinase/oxoprolinase family protein [Sphingomonas sp.]|uniref:hydantoinase/oxoprolinase family protein n=1 Tax=Sphingomonas sp. TaxID=28214 RepID=UPI000DB44AB7|nr:hydantoinase/oxoprolinase family protein [Sphingomonas sp.]PZU06402.1 MAG: methylhydantoinase [Sphingomonas sp.]
MARYRIAIDIGGTFVDAVQLDCTSGTLKIAKAATTPSRPADGVIEAVRLLGTPLDQTDIFVHGTTLPLNAIIERKGARTGFITNAGFRDVLEIGRANTPSAHMYDFAYEKPAPLVARRHRHGIAGRLDASGCELIPLDEDAVRTAARALAAQDVSAVAVTLLHSYVNPAHEAAIAQILRREFPELAVSVSSEICREYREYERGMTTVLDAYIRPIFKRYIGELRNGLERLGFTGQFLVMRSSGGATTAELAMRAPIFTVMSGPAGGIVGATELARAIDRPRVITLDYGGTSLDTSVVEDFQPSVALQASLESLPLLIPIFDIRCIGAGGGSIASATDGMLEVGPRSAGADPGPIAFRKGGVEPTTTDAAIILGYMDPGGFLGGRMPLDAEGSRAGLDRCVAAPLGLSIDDAAAGIFDILVARTVGAIREITVERGKDPSDFAFLAFGGAGPLIAPLLMRELEIAELIVPTLPAAFSARGMLLSDVVSEFAQTDIITLSEAALPRYHAHAETVSRRVTETLAGQGFDPADLSITLLVQCRYAGQENVLEVPFAPTQDAAAIAESFIARHLQIYGHAIPNAAIQIVTLRACANANLDKPPFANDSRAATKLVDALKTPRDGFCFALRSRVSFNVFDREKLRPGHVLAGPAIIEEATSTTVIHSDQHAEIDRMGNIIVTQAKP